MEVVTVMRNNIKKPDYYVVDDSYAPVDESTHKRAQISALDTYNWGLDGSEHSNK